MWPGLLAWYFDPDRAFLSLEGSERVNYNYGHFKKEIISAIIFNTCLQPLRKGCDMGIDLLNRIVSPSVLYHLPHSDTIFGTTCWTGAR